MENDDFETILTVKEFDNSCTFYHGLLPNLKVCVVSNFMLKFKMQCNKTLKIYALNELVDPIPQKTKLLNFKFKSSELEHAVEFLLQHDIKFVSENNSIRTFDPDGNMIIISGSEYYDFSSINPDRKTRKVKIS